MKDPYPFAITPIALAVMALSQPGFAQEGVPTTKTNEEAARIVQENLAPANARDKKKEALLLAQAAGSANPADPAKPAVQAVERLTVTGYRASVESALNAKREETAIVDVIKAEDIAKFPDTNLAEALQRLPGVVIDRDAGEGRNITVRGLGGDFVRVRINGLEALATTGGTDSSGGANRSRAFDFNVFPADLFNTLMVRKSSSADVEEGSLGATIELQTPKPFDFPGRVMTASFQERYNDLSRSYDPKVGFLVSDRFFGGTMGLLVSGAMSSRNVFEEGFSTVRWDNGPSSGGWCAPQGVTANPSNSTATTCGPSAQGVPRLPASSAATDAYNTASNAANFHPRLPRYGRLTHDQDRSGFTGTFQWRMQPETLVTADYLYSKLKATRQEDFLEALSFSRTATQGGKPQTSVVDTAYGSNGALLYGLYNGVDIRAESRFDELSTTYTQPSLTLEHEFSATLKLSAKVGRAESKFDNPVQTTTTLDALNVNGYRIDFRGNDRLPVITYPFDVTAVNPLTVVGVPQVTSGTQPATIANTTSSEIRIRPQGATNRLDVGRFDLAWDAMPDRLKVTGGYDYKQYKFDTFEFRRVNQNDTIFAPPNGATVASLTTSLNGFGRGLSLPAGVPTSWIIPNLGAIAQAYNIYCNCLQSGPSGGPGDYTLSSTTNGNARGNNRKVVETDNGAWAMGDFHGQLFGLPVRGNAGFRYVETKQEATGFQANAGGTEVTVTNNYSDWLPSLNLVMDLRRDLLLRFAAAKVMARPQLGNLNPGGTISTTGNLTITVGNPLLEPFRAKTYDASLEWYFDRSSLFGVGLFRKDIDTYIQTLRTTIPYNQTGLPISLLPPNFTGEEVFQVTTPVNTPGGSLSGVELNYQQQFRFLPGWGKYLGTLLNYTYVKSKIDYLVSPTATTTITDDLLNLSPRTWNATLYYDDETFSARVSAAYRQSFLTRVPGQNNNDVEGKNSTTNIDAQISYKLTKNVDITLEGTNLTNEAVDQFISRDRNSVVVHHVTGREYMIGVRAKF